MLDYNRTGRYGQPVARTADPHKREQLLGDVVGYLQEHGVNDLSLAPLAAAIGTSKRMLLYYFGDRDGLLAQALDAARPKAGVIFEDITTGEQVAAAATRLWQALTRGSQQRKVPMLLQVLSLAATDPDTYGAHARTMIEVMLTPIAAAFAAAGFDAPEADRRATLIVSGLRGLCQDLLVTGDYDRLDAAAALLIQAAVHAPATAPGRD